MKSNIFVVAPVAMAVLAPTLAAQIIPDAKTSLAAMKANVAKITAPDEKERWQLNLAAWQSELGQAAATKPDFDAIAVSLGKMKANVAKVTAADEKERWSANLELWQLLVSRKGAFDKADQAAAKALVAKIVANVAKITDAAEKERWAANRDLWRSMVERKPATAS